MKLKQNSIQFFLYLIVGGLAAIVEWLVFYFLNSIFSLNYIAATILAFILSTAANWIFGRIILFHKTKENTIIEIVKVYVVSIIGLLLNILIMFVAIEKIGLIEMLAKIVATGIVFFWNFLIRKFVIYKI